MSVSECYLVTGGMGCLGAWTIYHLLKEGKKVVNVDLSETRHRLKLLLSPEEEAKIAFERVDITDLEALKACFARHQVSHVIHLAALQVPFCKANPALGAQVNVTGTVNVFEAAKTQGIKHLSYASSIAVYGSAEDYKDSILKANAPMKPRTLYGVYKVANEKTARVYWLDEGMSSIALRPYTVYGLGRDQGLTSEPSKAILAAAKGENFQISFGGKMQFHYASDVARQFISASRTPLAGAYGFCLGGVPVAVQEVADIIMRLRPKVNISVTEKRLSFPEGFEDSELRKHFDVYETPLEVAIAESLEVFARIG
ncbi:MAG: NAD-dependent epimerase/dehydratase family protein [Deinococcales bacterium]